MNQVISITSAKADCGRCGQASRCLPQGMDNEQLEHFSSAVTRRRVLQRGEHLFMQHDASETIYLLRSGALKSFAVDVDGEEQVLGFHLPGDVLGLDAVGSGFHHSSAVVLETVSVCELSFARLQKLSGGLDLLQQKLHALFGGEIARDYQLLRLLGRKNAEQRLSGFLFQLSQRFAERGYAADEFNLSMSRHDIGDYLGLALETVSRLFGRLQKQGVLAVDRRQVKILDQARLAALAGEPPVSHRYAS